MKIEIRNLGPIAMFEFDINKDFTLIFGKNNIGKSYAITAVYLIIKNLTSLSFVRNSLELGFYYYGQDFYMGRIGDGNKFYKGMSEAEDRIDQKFKDQEVDEIQITADIENQLAKVINELFLQNLEQSFNNSFSSIENLTNRLTNEKFSITLIYDSMSVSIGIEKNKFVVNGVQLFHKIILKRSAKQRKKLISEDKIIFYHVKKAKDKELIRVRFLDAILSHFYSAFRNELVKSINNIYFLPASRSGLYQALSTFSAVIAELSKSRNFLTHKIELPNISEPVSDYFLYLSNINNKKINKNFSSITKNIESSILEGNINFNSDSKKIVFASNKIDVELDLSATSSMISEIAPIVAYLKYIVTDKREHDLPFGDREGDNAKKRANVIFIEEPEAHLHPVIQVKMVEVFSELIKHNVKIVMTTHSNYMLNKLSNLILENKVSHGVVGSYLMKMGAKGSLLDAISMQADSEGINDENFADVSEQLYEERIKIYDKLNQDANK